MTRQSSHLLTVAEVARAAGRPPRTMLYQLRKLQRTFPHLMKAFNPPGTKCRKWRVDARLLEKIDRLGKERVQQEEEARLQALESAAARLDELEMKLAALTEAHAALKRTWRAKRSRSVSPSGEQPKAPLQRAPARDTGSP